MLPIPTCADGNHSSQGYWYYTNDLKLGSPYNPKSGRYYGMDCFMIIHTSGVFSTSNHDEWIYTPCHGAFPRSIEVLGVYPGTCFGDTQELKVYDWARNKTGDGDAFRRIDYLSNMNVYKISMDDGFGHTQTYMHVLNFTRWSSSINKWINELFILNTTPPGSWVRKYYYEYSDYDYITEYGGLSVTWSKWAGILEFYSDGVVNPIPLKEVGFKNLFRVFDGNIQPLNSPYLAFRQDTIPSGNSNRNNIRWQDYTTWTAGATTGGN